MALAAILVGVVAEGRSRALAVLVRIGLRASAVKPGEEHEHQDEDRCVRQADDGQLSGEN